MSIEAALGAEPGREIRAGWLLGVLAVLTVAAAAASLMLGRAGIGAGVADLFTVAHTDPAVAWTILVQVRLPRMLLALLVGASLGLSGAVLQGLLRNPLAEPALLGASSSAALGAVVVFYFAGAGSSAFLPLGGMAGTLIATALLLQLGGGARENLTLILAGIAINALTAALTALALNFAPSPYAALEIIFWLLGSFADRALVHVYLTLPPMMLGWVLLLSTGRALDALTLGEEAAGTLGFDLRAVRLRAILGTAACVGAAVAVTGVIGFVGLVVPHLVRPWVGYRPGRVLIASMLGGAALMIIADVVARLIPTSTELKVGVVTALIGAPFFLHLLLTLRRTA